MALKVELKPGERIILGTCVITNDKQRTRLFIEGNAPILRQKDVLTPETADTPAKRIYLTVQMMYLEDDIEKFREEFFVLVDDLVTAAPSTLPYIDDISGQILAGKLYSALKSCAKLVAYEEGVMSHASGSVSL